MSFTKIRSGGNGLLYNYSYFFCDTIEDLDLILVNQGFGSCSPGSKAFVLNTQKNYILSNNHIWTELTTSGSGGNNINLDRIALVDEVLDYLDI